MLRNGQVSLCNGLEKYSVGCLRNKIIIVLGLNSCSSKISGVAYISIKYFDETLFLLSKAKGIQDLVFSVKLHFKS